MSFTTALAAGKAPKLERQVRPFALSELSTSRSRLLPFAFLPKLGYVLISNLLQLYSASASEREQRSSVSVARSEGNGNQAAAADLYGTGIRLGIYMQTIGMLMSLVSDEQPKLKFAAATTSITVLLSWTILAQRKSFSACEAWLILSIIGTFILLGGAALCNIQDVAGEAVGIIAIWVSILWLFGSIIWLFASLLYHLPTLGTSNTVWIFLQEPIDGWFRILMLVVGCILLTISFFTALTSATLVRKAMRAWCAHTPGEVDPKIPWMKSEATKSEAMKIEATKSEAMKSFRYSQCSAGLLMWMFAILSSEKIIQWNGLSPENDLSRPGQAIPLVVGILILIDGIGDLFKCPSRFVDIGMWGSLLRQMTLGSLKNFGRTTSLLLLLWKEWRSSRKMIGSA